jgi:hypothetical protein
MLNPGYWSPVTSRIERPFFGYQAARDIVTEMSDWLMIYPVTAIWP